MERRPSGSLPAAVQAGDRVTTPNWAYRVERTDSPRSMMSYGTRTLSEGWEARALAEEVARETRQLHNYGGALAVLVWPHRGDDEHYRTPPPADAEKFTYGLEAVRKGLEEFAATLDPDLAAMAHANIDRTLGRRYYDDDEDHSLYPEPSLDGIPD